MYFAVNLYSDKTCVVSYKVSITLKFNVCLNEGGKYI